MSIKIKTILIIASLLTAVSTFAAQQKVDTTYPFGFVPHKYFFYVPLDGNDRELARRNACAGTRTAYSAAVFRSMWTATAIPLTAKRKTCGWPPSVPTG